MDATNGATLSSEAPVSWNTRYVDPRGYDCMLTLRGSDLKQVMTVATAALAAMAAQGCKPGTGHASPAAAIGSNGTGAAGPLCPVHKTPMKQSKHGGWYCPAKVAEDDGSGRPVYCKAKATQ